MTLRIALFGELGIGNLGNDMSCRQVRDRLAQVVPGARLTALVRDAGRAEQVLGLPAVSFATSHGSSALARVAAKLVDAAGMLRVVGRFDLVVVPGTGLLEEATARLPGGDLVWLALLSLACRVRRVPLVWVGLGGSRYAHRVPALVAAWAARGARRRSYRDTMTRDSLGRAGLDVCRDTVMHDVVLGADPAPTVPAAAGGHVVVSVINVLAGRGRARYAATMAQVVDRLAAAGDQVLMLVVDDADVAATDEVLALLDGPAPPTVHPTDLEGLVGALADADVVVASRYHALVGTLLAGRCPVAVAHADKDVAVMAQAGLDDYLLSIDDVSADDVLRLVASSRADAARVRQAGDQVCRAARASVGTEMAALGAVLERRRWQRPPG